MNNFPVLIFPQHNGLHILQCRVCGTPFTSTTRDNLRHHFTSNDAHREKFNNFPSLTKLDARLKPIFSSPSPPINNHPSQQIPLVVDIPDHPHLRLASLPESNTAAFSQCSCCYYLYSVQDRSSNDSFVKHFKSSKCDTHFGRTKEQCRDHISSNVVSLTATLHLILGDEASLRRYCARKKVTCFLNLFRCPPTFLILLPRQFSNCVELFSALVASVTWSPTKPRPHRGHFRRPRCLPRVFAYLTAFPFCCLRG